LAEKPGHAEAAFRRFRARWLREYGPMVRRRARDLPQLLSVFAFPRHLRQKLRTTNVIERCFVEVRRRTRRPMMCFVNVESVDRIIYSIFRDSIWNGKPAPSTYLHKQLDVTLCGSCHCFRHAPGLGYAMPLEAEDWGRGIPRMLPILIIVLMPMSSYLQFCKSFKTGYIAGSFRHKSLPALSNICFLQLKLRGRSRSCIRSF
jgi:hypothetical protein